MTERIWSLALPGTSRDQADAARYLQEQGDNHKAILLYHKAGMIHKALDLAFRLGKNFFTLMAAILNAR